MNHDSEKVTFWKLRLPGYTSFSPVCFLKSSVTYFRLMEIIPLRALTKIWKIFEKWRRAETGYYYVWNY